MAFYVVRGKTRRKFRTRRGAAWHKRKFGGRVVAKAARKSNPKTKRRRKTTSRRRKSTRRRR